MHGRLKRAGAVVQVKKRETVKMFASGSFPDCSDAALLDATKAARVSHAELGWKKLLALVNKNHGWKIDPTRFKSLMKQQGFMHAVPDQKPKKVAPPASGEQQSKKAKSSADKADDAPVLAVCSFFLDICVNGRGFDFGCLGCESVSN